MSNPIIKNTFKTFFSFLLVLIFTNVCFSQKNNIKFTMITLNKLGLSYEVEIAPQKSLLVYFKKYKVTYNLFEIFPESRYQNDGFRFMAEIRFYSTPDEEKLKGFYVGPNFSIGKHKLYYKELEELEIISWPDSDNESVPELASGNAVINAKGLGLKIGYQYYKKRLVLDVGTNLTYNIPIKNKIDFKLDNDETVRFKSDLVGFFPEVYLGFGFSF